MFIGYISRISVYKLSDYCLNEYMLTEKKSLFLIRLHKKCSLLLRISSVNVTKTAVSCGFGHIY